MASRSHSPLLIAILTFAAIVAGAASVDAASLSLSWDAPTTDVDGAPLSDLAEYRVYLATALPACPGGPFFTVESPTTTPVPGDTLASRVTSLSRGARYFVRVTAVDAGGNEGPCSDLASGIAQLDFSVTASAGTSFGSVLVGSALDRDFTVQNTSTATISGGVSVGAPFSILSGRSFSLAPGASQTVTVRFQPITDGTFAGSVNFTANGDTLSIGLSGSTNGASGSPVASGPGDAPGTPSVTLLATDPAGATFLVAWGAASGATAYSYGAAFNDGSAAQQGAVTGLLSFPLWMPYHASGAASGGFVCLQSIDAAGQQSIDQSCAAVSVPAASVPLSSSAALPPPGTPSVTLLATDAAGATFLVAWGAASGATSYSYEAAFNDGSAAQQRTVAFLLSFQLRMPYHASGAAFGGFVCLRSINAAWQQSTDQSCTGVSVPASPGFQPPSNPVPVFGSLSPASAVAGGAGLTLTVNGSGFVASSVVRWNGAPRTTTFVSATQLRAVITAADLAIARTVLASVITPSPGGGTSRTVNFTVTVPPPPEPPPTLPMDPP
jgi:hypothetical protein